MSRLIGQIKNFFKKQTENFKVLIITSVMTSFHRGLATGRAAGGGGGGGAATSGASYLQLYLRALGADSQQLGLLNSLGRIAGTIAGLPLGWISDRFSLKKVVVFGYALSVIVPLAYALSANWSQAIPAMMIDNIARTIVGMLIATFFVTSVKESSDRATAMSVRSTIISLIGLAVPTIAAIIVSNFGGISVEGIRPLFIVSTFIALSIAIYAQLKLAEVAFLEKKDTEPKKRSFFQDYKEIASISAVKKWVFFKGIRQFFGNSLMPFYSIYYVEVKGADPVIIAAMGTIATIGSLIVLVPFGRLADKQGRKKIIFLTRPFYYFSLLLAVLSPSPEWLILASFLGVFHNVSNLMEITMEWELVPAEQRGRLAGFQSFWWGLVSVPGPMLAGFLWDRVNQAYLLLTPILVDCPFLVNLLTTPDTLHKVYEKPS